MPLQSDAHTIWAKGCIVSLRISSNGTGRICAVAPAHVRTKPELHVPRNPRVSQVDSGSRR
jgi:hypothetical protein